MRAAPRLGLALPTLVLVAALLAAAVAGAETRRWTVLAGKSQAGFDATFPMGNFPGKSEEVTGEFRADPADLRQGVAGTLRVQAGSLRTGNESRDRDMWKLLAVDRYPEISFTVERVEPSFPSVTDRADVLLTISGRMRLRGLERPMVVAGRVRLRDDKLWVRGEGELRLTDFGMEPPARLFVKVGDVLRVSFDVVLAPDD